MRPIHPKRCRAAQGRRGSALVEFMIAAVVLVVGVSASALQSARAHALRDHTEQRLTASAHLRGVMASVLEQEPEDLLAEDSVWRPGAVDVSANLVQCLPDQRTTVDYPGFATGDPAPELLPVVIRVEWERGDGDMVEMELCSAVKR